MKKTGNSLERRNFLKFSLAGAVFLATSQALASKLTLPSLFTNELADFIANNKKDNPNNFHSIYDVQELKEQFYLFLKNVYNIYPQDEFHNLISKTTELLSEDEKIYQKILENLGDIKPLFSELTYAIPALKKQKIEITAQTLELVDGHKNIENYLEIGTPGRYVDNLKEALGISGEIFLLDKNEPKYNPLDIVERGQFTKIGKYLPLNNYDPIPDSIIKNESLDLVTNYIGFHHSPLYKLENFVISINKTLKKGGVFILRDHDVINEDMNHMVSLAHDVFNVGLEVEWQDNHNEVRNFRTLKGWIIYLEKRGFEFQNKILFQEGDPTKNGLMKFIKR